MATLETSPALLTMLEVAHRLNVSKKTAYRMTWTEGLPTVRIGHGRGQLRVDEQQLEAWIRDRKVNTNG